jgi:hypothetical protein
MKFSGIVTESETLRLNNFGHKSSLQYECIADNSVDEPLRKSIRIFISGKRNKF